MKVRVTLESDDRQTANQIEAIYENPEFEIFQGLRAIGDYCCESAGCRPLTGALPGSKSAM
jgi:hypothetical protein